VARWTGRGSASRALDASTVRGVSGEAAQTLVQKLLETGIDGRGPFESARAVAAAALAAHPDPERAVRAVISRHLRLASASGFVTSLGGFVTMPVALPANVTGFYLLATRMTAAVAAIRGHDIDDRAMRTAVLLSLVGADAEEVLRKAGLRSPVGRLTSLAGDRLPGPALVVVNKAVGFRILATAGKDVFARFGKAVPVVGGAVGAGLDAYLMSRLAEHAKEEFPPAARQITGSSREPEAGAVASKPGVDPQEP